MEKGVGTNLLRARLNTPILYHVFNLVFATLIAGILVIVVFFNVYTFGGIRFSWYTKLGVGVCSTLFSLMLFWLFSRMPKPKKGTEATIVVLLMVIFLALQGFVGWQLQQVVAAQEAGGFAQVYQLAADAVLTGAQPGQYFLHNPHNIALYTLLCGFFSLLNLFGVSNFILPSLWLNIAAIAGGLVLLYFTSRRLFGVYTGIFVLVAACLTSPFLLHAPFLYTNTLLLPLPIAAVLLWLGARSRWREGQYTGALVRFCVLSGLLALGALLRLSILVLWLAVVADLLLLLCGKGRAMMLLAGTGALAVVLVGGAFALLYSPLMPATSYGQDGMPLSKGLLMGLSTTGGYNEADEQLLLAQQDRNVRGQVALQEVQNRLAQRGVLGQLQHLGDKLSYTFGDASYGAMGAMQGEPSGFVQEVLTNNLMALLYYAVQVATLFWMLMAAIQSFVRRNEALVFVRLAVFGLMIFLLVWETQPGYVVCFLPLFLLCAAEAGPRPSALRQKDLPAEHTARRVPENQAEVVAVLDYMSPEFQWEKPLVPQWSPLTPQPEAPAEPEAEIP